MNAIQDKLAAQDKVLLWCWEQWKFGADLHRAGEPFTRCTNDEQVRGYLDALKAAADAETYAYLQRIR